LFDFVLICVNDLRKQGLRHVRDGEKKAGERCSKHFRLKLENVMTEVKQTFEIMWDKRVKDHSADVGRMVFFYD
jgi:hypothetical protein